MEKIVDGDLLLALIVCKRDFPNGMNFWGSDDAPLQFGSCVYPKGVVLQPHIHKKRKRTRAHKTIELVCVLHGAIKTMFYSLDKVVVCTRVLREGDCVMLYDGGHGFKILKDNTVFIEVKNGPYVSVEADKEKFGDSAN